MIDETNSRGPRERDEAGHDAPVAGPAARHQPASKQSQPRSIAVLPFVDLSAECDEQHFCDGLAHEIISDLTRIEGLKVASRTSSFAFKDRRRGAPEIDRELAAQEIGATLGTDLLVVGAVDKTDGRLSVSAELIDVANGESLWSESFDRAMTDIFAIREEIATQIVDALQLRLSDAQRRAIGKAATHDAEAYDLYLRGAQLFFQSTRKSIDAAIAMFNRALAKDPSYALAFAGVADCYSYRFMYFDSDIGNLKYARNASKHALTLDHELAEAHAARGLAVSLSQRYEEAEAAFEEAIRLDPRLYEAYYFYARTCFVQGKNEQACSLYETASRVNPDDIQATSLLAFSYRTMGDDVRADEAARRALQRLERHLDLNPDDPRAIYLAADNLLQLEKREEAVRYVQRAASLAPEDPYTLYGLACIYSRLEEIDEAMAALEAAVSGGFGHREWIVNDGDFDPLRVDPRFQDLLDKLAAAGTGGIIVDPQY